jgi:hypothetical protein
MLIETRAQSYEEFTRFESWLMLFDPGSYDYDSPPRFQHSTFIWTQICSHLLGDEDSYKDFYVRVQ